MALDLGPRASRSLRLDRLFPDLASHTGPFSARIAGSGIRFAAAATLLGGELQAPLFLPAQAGISGSELLIPRVARGPGAFNTFQFSRLLAANPSPQARELRCELWLRGQDGRAASRVATLKIPPRGSVFVEDVLHDLFGLSEALGALRISWNGEGPAPRVLSLTVSTARGGAGQPLRRAGGQPGARGGRDGSTPWTSAPALHLRPRELGRGQPRRRPREPAAEPARALPERWCARPGCHVAPEAELRAGAERNLPADRRRPLDASPRKFWGADRCRPTSSRPAPEGTSPSCRGAPIRA